MASYIVLARKWRPALFKEVVGQSHVLTTLQNAILSNRLAHAYLFSGPRGVGKTTIARILAKAVNCLTRTSDQAQPRPQSEPCNNCINCKEISAGRSIDVIEIDAASNRGIDEIRELRENVKFAPSSCNYKVYIIDEVHMLTTEAFNALLKTLEDPPSHVLFVLATTERHKIPETILSRCQQFEFKRMSYFEIVERLRKICQEERFSVSDQALELISRQSEGGLRDAEVALDQLISYSNGDVNVEDVSSLLGLGSYNLFEQLVKNLIGRQGAEALKTLNTLVAQGADLSRLLNSLISHFGDLLIIKLHPDPKGLINVSDSKLADLKLQAEGISLQRLMTLVRILMKTAKDIKQFGYEQLNLECCFVEVCQLADGLQLEEAISKLSELQAKLGRIVLSTSTSSRSAVSKNHQSEPVEPVEPVKSIKPIEAVETIETMTNEGAISDAADVNINSIDSIWNALLDRFRQKEKRIYALIEYGKPLEMKAETFVLGFSETDDFFKRQLEKEDNRKFVETELSQVLSQKMRIKVLTSEKVKPRYDHKAEAEKSSVASQLLLQREAMDNKNVQLVLNIFGGEIVKVNSKKE